MEGTIKAIDTIYNGYKFRSRLEARWAVFFDDLGIKYEYEKEGFDLGEEGWYLPDFWLPQVKMWAEVKPEIYENWLEKNDDYANQISKISVFVSKIKQPCLLLYGLPKAEPYEAVIWPEDGNGCCTNTFCLTNYHGYIYNENRFYGSPGDGDTLAFEGIVERSIAKARQARFEYEDFNKNI